MSVRGTADGCHLTWRKLFSSPEARAASVPPVCAHRLPKTDGIPRLLTAKAGKRRTGSLGRPAHWRFGRSVIPRQWNLRSRKGRRVRHDRCRGLQCRYRRTETVPEYHRRGLDALDVNLMGTVRTIRAVLPGMLHNHKGSIVTVSSMMGECGASCEPLFREQGCDYRPEQVAPRRSWARAISGSTALRRA